MKNKLTVIILMMSLAASSCSEDDGPGQFAGSWEFNLSGSQSHQISAMFDISGKESSYEVSDIHFNGLAWQNGEVQESSGNHVSKIYLRKMNDESDVTKIAGLVFIDCTITAGNSLITVDSVVHAYYDAANSRIQYDVYRNQLLVKQ